MFKPKRVLFEKGTLDTEVGQNIYNMIKDDKNISRRKRNNGSKL